MGEIIAIDFSTVPTVRQRVPFVVIVLAHHRRRVLHFGVTEHPTSEWTAQQVVEAFAEREPSRYLIRDRDASYGIEFRSQHAASDRTGTAYLTSRFLRSSKRDRTHKDTWVF